MNLITLLAIGFHFILYACRHVMLHVIDMWRRYFFENIFATNPVSIRSRNHFHAHFVRHATVNIITNLNNVPCDPLTAYRFNGNLLKLCVYQLSYVTRAGIITVNRQSVALVWRQVWWFTYHRHLLLRHLKSSLRWHMLHSVHQFWVTIDGLISRWFGELNHEVIQLLIYVWRIIASVKLYSWLWSGHLHPTGTVC